MTAIQGTLSDAVPMQTCEVHGEYDPRAYFTPTDIDEMLDDGGIDCPLCLQEIVGESAT